MKIDEAEESKKECTGEYPYHYQYHFIGIYYSSISDTTDRIFYNNPNLEKYLTSCDGFTPFPFCPNCGEELLLNKTRTEL